MYEMIIYLIFGYYFLLMLLENIVKGSSDLNIQLLELSHSNARASSRVLLNIFNLNLLLVHPVVNLDVIVDRKYLCETLFVKHLVDPFCHHSQQFFFIWVSHPKYKTVLVA